MLCTCVGVDVPVTLCVLVDLVAVSVFVAVVGTVLTMWTELVGVCDTVLVGAAVTSLQNDIALALNGSVSKVVPPKFALASYCGRALQGVRKYFRTPYRRHRPGFAPRSSATRLHRVSQCSSAAVVGRDFDQVPYSCKRLRAESGEPAQSEA